MAAQSNQAKVLRIGIIQDGKIVQERLVKAGDNVTVGDSAKNTFVLPKTGLPRSEFPLFVHKGGQYHLFFTEKMAGKVSSEGGVNPLDKLRSDSSVTKQGDVWALALTEKDRGKIQIDQVTVLFQFVPPPPAVAPTPLEKMDFRPRMLDDDDPAFLGFLALFTALGVIFSVFIYLAPPPPEMTFDKVPERFAKVVVKKEKKEPEPVQEEEKEEEPDPNAEAEKTEAQKEEPVESKPKDKPKDKVEAAKQKDERKQEMAAKLKAQFALIGSTGRSSGPGVAGFDGKVLSNLKGMGGVDVAVDGAGPKKGDVSTEDVKVEDLKTGDVGTTSGSAAPVVEKIDVEMDIGSGDLSDMTGGENVQAVVKNKSGQLQYCYEEQLRSSPNLSGRVEVSWTITNKRVTAVEVLVNTTGNSALASCIQKKIKRWRFPEDAEGTVSWPFVFRKK